MTGEDGVEGAGGAIGVSPGGVGSDVELGLELPVGLEGGFGGVVKGRFFSMGLAEPSGGGLIDFALAAIFGDEVRLHS